jgi:hypothetical protein
MLLDIHAVWAWVVIIGNGLGGVWILTAWRKPAIRSRAMWWFIIGVEIATFIQVALGAALVGGQKKHVAAFHMFYGFVALVFIAIIYSYRAQLMRKLYQLYGFGSLFLMGLGIRALMKVHG